MVKISKIIRSFNLLLISVCLVLAPVLSVPMPARAAGSTIQWPVDVTSGSWKISSGYNSNDHGCGGSSINCSLGYQLYGLDISRSDDAELTDGTIIKSPVTGRIAYHWAANQPNTGQCVVIAVDGYPLSAVDNMSTRRVSLCHVDISSSGGDGSVVQRGVTTIGSIASWVGNQHLHFSVYDMDPTKSESSENWPYRKPIPFNGDMQLIGCGSYDPNGTLNWSTKSYNGTSQFTGSAISCPSGPGKPGGWWLGPTPDDGTASLVSPLALAVNVHGQDKTGSGLKKIDITWKPEGSSQWSKQTKWLSTPIQYDSDFSYNIPAPVGGWPQSIIISFDVYSNDGQYTLSPQGMRRVCLNNTICTKVTQNPEGGGGSGGTGGGQTGCTPGQYQAAVFTDANYGGSCVVKDVGTYNDPSAIGLPNDSITSLKIGSGAQLTLCDNAGINSPCEWFTQDDPDLANNTINTNTVSSLRVEGNQPTNGCNPSDTQVSFFDNPDWTGLCITKNFGVYNDPGAIGLSNDSISSIKVGARAKVRVCNNAGMNSPCEEFDQSDSNLNNNSINTDTISAAEVYLKGGIRLCDNTNYGGECKYFGTGKYNLQDYGFNNRTESVAYDSDWAGLYHIVLYTEDGQTGYLYHADNSTNNLFDPYNNNISSIDIYKHQPPGASLGAPANGAALTGNSVTLNFDGGDSRRVHVWGNGFDQNLDWTTAKTWQLSLPSGTFSWQAQARGVAGEGVWTEVRTFSVNSAPAVQGGELSMNAGTSQTIQVVATDAENSTITLSASGLPSWATFVDNGSGVGTLTLSPGSAVAGTFPITINASDGTSTGSGTVNVSVVGQPSTTYQAQYYNNKTLSGTPVLTRNESSINYSWGSGSPDPSVSVDNFSARWSRVVTLNEGMYTFAATGDDGLRLYVDGQLVIDKWIDQGASRYYFDKQMSQGNHSIVYEYYEAGGGATAQLSFYLKDLSKPYTAQYFNNTSLSGTPALTRTDYGVDYWWGSASPVPGTVNPDNFSVKWTRTENLAAGTYKFTASGDDGMRLYVDGQLAINGWNNPGTTNNGTAYLTLPAGSHSIVFEYYENGGWASTKLTYAIQPQTVVSQVSASADDAEERVASRAVDLVSSDLEFTCDSAVTPCQSTDPGQQILGLRFNSLNIPKNAIINSANIEFMADESQSESSYMIFRGEATDNAQPFTNTAGNISSRPTTAGSSAWSTSLTAWAAGTKYTSAGVVTAVKEVVGRSGWQPGNSLVLIATGLGHRTADSFDKIGGTPAKLIVTYTPSTTPPPAPPAPTVTAYQAQYYNNIDLSGAPVLARDETAINNDWGSGGPGSGVNNDNFSARWTKYDNYEADDYTFTITGDDGVRLYIDDVLVVDKWIDQGATTYWHTKNMTAGSHKVVMEYYERGGGAVAKLSYAKASASANYQAQYYNNIDLSGTPVLTRLEPVVNNDWGGNGPGSGVNNDNFSARWTKTASFNAGSYNFSVTADDGVRLWVDNELVIDRWVDQGATTYTAARTLSAGTHTIKMEYYERGGGAVAKLSY